MNCEDRGASGVYTPLAELVSVRLDNSNVYVTINYAVTEDC